MEALRSPHYGRLSFGADTTVGSYVIPGLLGKFRQSFPAVEISLEVLNRVSLIDALLSNRVDMVVMGAVPDDAPVEIEPFAYNPLVLIAAPNHRLAGRPDISIKELGREHFLLREPGSGTRSALETTLKEAGVSIDDIARVCHIGFARGPLDTIYLDPLGVDCDRGVWDYTRRIGHTGAADLFLGLEHLWSTRQVGPGDYVLLIGAATGTQTLSASGSGDTIIAGVVSVSGVGIDPVTSGSNGST